MGESIVSITFSVRQTTSALLQRHGVQDRPVESNVICLPFLDPRAEL